MQDKYQTEKEIDKSVQILSDITAYMKYARYLPEKKRREIWNETVHRSRDMHIAKFPELEKDIMEAFAYVEEKKLLPSMRSMQFAGKPIEVNPTRIYNCSYMHIDNLDAFPEAMFLMLSGTGVGYSVQKHHVGKLPPILGVQRPEGRQRKKRYLVGDSIEGWADAIKVLIESYFYNKREIDFDFRDIRPKGSLLITSGGKAPGPEPLRECIVKITSLLENAIAERGRATKLTPLEAHDIMCYIADAVLAGGIRRAAMLSLFSLDDSSMLECKFGNWWEKNPQRGRANNSAVVLRSQIDKETFMGLWEKVQASGSGEPGFFMSNSEEWGTNPCFTGDTMIAVADGRNAVSIEQLAKEQKSFEVYSAKVTSKNRWKTEVKSAVAFETGVKEVLEITLSNGDTFKCTPDHRLALPDGTYIEAKDSLHKELEGFFTYVPEKKAKHRYINSFTNGYSKQHRYIWEYHNGKKPEGYAIDHIENNGDDSLENLQLLTIQEHDYKTGIERLGSNNPVHKIRDKVAWKRKLSRASFLSNNPNYNGLTNEELIAIGRRALKEGCLTYKGCKAIDERFPLSFSKNRFNGSWKVFKDIVDGSIEYEEIQCEDIQTTTYESQTYVNPVVTKITKLGKQRVFDLTVEDNHNFYILTHGDDGYRNSEGVLVHNCAEISLRTNQFCNLVEINFATVESQEDLNTRAKYASFIATLQASYTDFHYLRDIWRETTEKEALIGVSLTGVATKHLYNYDLKEAARIVKEENKRVAKLIGINSSARSTTNKPSGTSSIILGTSSGVHAWYDYYYWRRVRVGKDESMYRYLSMMHPELLEDDYFRPETTSVIKVPQKAPDDGIIRTESALDTLTRVKYMHENWISAGHTKGINRNNVSCTINIREYEWKEVGEWLWDNRNTYTGISVLPYDNGSYIQPPFEPCTKKEYEEAMKYLGEVNLEHIVEEQDNTNLQGEVACTGGACEVKYL